MTEKTTFPDIDVGDAIRLFESASRSNPLLKKAYDLCATGRFVDDDGKVDNIKDNGVSLDEGGLIYFLIEYLSPNITFETGFGGGASACVFVGAKKSGTLFEKKMHSSLDPNGLDDGMGKIVERHLRRNYKKNFRLIKELSEIALPTLIKKHKSSIKLSLIDGSHMFENALMDFVFLDRMCALGGCIMLDDADQPSVGSALSYIKNNRSDYTVQMPCSSMALLWKNSDKDTRDWDHYKPFEASQTDGWIY